MRKKYTFLLFCNLIFCVVFSQEHNSTQWASDTLKCYQLNIKIENENNHLIWIRYNDNLKKISALNFNCKDQKFRKQFQKYYATALLNQGAFYNYCDQYELAIANYKKSFVVAKSIHFYEECASNLQNIGTAFDYLGKLDSSLVYFKKALIFANQSKNKSNIAYVLTDLGHVYNLKGNTSLAIENNLKALTVFEEIKDFEGIERTYFALGRIFDGQKEFNKAISYYKKGLVIAVKNNFDNRICVILNSLSNSFFQLKKFNEAESYANKSLIIAQKDNFETAKAMSLMHLGDINFSQNKLAVAQTYFLESAKLFEKYKVYNSYAKVLIHLGLIHLKNENVLEAFQSASSAFKIANTSNYPAEKKMASELLSDIHKKNKNFKEAYFYQSLAKTIGDSIFYDENKSNVLKSEFKHETDKKEAQIQLLSQQKTITELENQKQKTIILFVIIGLIFTIIIVFLIFKRYKSNKENELLRVTFEEREKTLEAEKKATESELKALKSQMNPHFIFNALNSIQEQFMFGDKLIANEQMGNFTYLTRQILSVSGKKKISLATEVEILTKYLELEKMRFDTGFSYSISIEDTIDDQYVSLSPMLIQPFVENSIKHGLLHKDGQKKLEINFLLDDEEYLVCVIEDNGIGRKKSEEIKANSKHNSFSTQSIAQRLQLLNESKPIEDILVYEDLVDAKGNSLGTRVHVKIGLLD
ncbi:tetratricopeptide repeat-containing sensor histidine kinase [Flavobacterium sp. MAHUQ-51]|uniref:tetratricopeptide repeat-containing sensor histidine kinase n=1 Tax=Flavobacterium sp. GCM10022190 TaxID=3252639 RepID=UPI00360B6C5C